MDGSGCLFRYIWYNKARESTSTAELKVLELKRNGDRQSRRPGPSTQVSIHSILTRRAVLQTRQ